MQLTLIPDTSWNDNRLSVTPQRGTEPEEFLISIHKDDDRSEDGITVKVTGYELRRFILVFARLAATAPPPSRERDEE